MTNPERPTDQTNDKKKKSRNDRHDSSEEALQVYHSAGSKDNTCPGENAMERSAAGEYRKMNDLPESIRQPTNVAGGEGIPNDEAPSVAKRTRRSGKRNSPMRRSWKSLKRFMTKPIRPHQEKARRRGFIAWVVLLLAVLFVSLYFEAPIIWWFLVAAVVCGS